MSRSEKACLVCSRRKVKCDRSIPCGNCVRRGTESDCIRSSGSTAFSADTQDLTQQLYGWQNYEYWITNIGLLRSKNSSTNKHKVSLENDINVEYFWLNYLTQEQSYALLNFSVENLGTLYFSCVGDISDLFLQLERYWQRRSKSESDESSIFSANDYYCDALLWSIFTLSLYYLPIGELGKILPAQPICQWLDIDETQEWTETLQLTAYQGFTKTTLVLLQRSNFMLYPDIKLIQIFLVLSSTTFTYDDPILANNIILQCFQVAKTFDVSFFKQYSRDDTVVGLTKQIFSKIWFKLCSTDYIMSSPNKPIEFHKEIPSLLQHAAYYQDMPNYNLYQDEDNFEILYWKILSLEREIDRFLNLTQKPQPRTIDAVKREVENFNRLLAASLAKGKDSKSINGQFERFLVSFLLNTVNWKLYKTELIYFDNANSLELTIHYTQLIIGLLIQNITHGNDIFNKHPLVLSTVARIAPFFQYFTIFSPGVAAVEQLNVDFTDLLALLPIMLGDKMNKLNIIISRIRSLGILWEKIKVTDSQNGSVHPVFKIIQNDIKFMSRFNRRMPLMVTGVNNIGVQPQNYGLDQDDIDIDLLLNDDEDDIKESEEFKLIVATFQDEHSIEELVL